MGMYCELRQLSPEYAQRLLQNPGEVHHYVDQADTGRLPPAAQGEDLNLDKAWHGLHYLLTGTAWAGPEPASYLLAGGEPVGDADDHDVFGYGPARLLLPAQVAAFCTAAEALTPDEIHRRYHPAEMTRLEIYPEVWDRKGEDLQNNFAFLEEAARDLQAFLQHAVGQQQAVIIYFA